MAILSSFELEFLSVNAIGRSSEAGSLPTMKIGLATNHDANGNVTYKTIFNNSGYTLGFFQWDFHGKGERKAALGLIESYNKWAPENERIKNIDDATNKLMLGGHIHTYDRHGNISGFRKNPLEGQPDIRLQGLGHKLNNFIGSEAGNKYVMSLQEKHYREALEPKLKEIMNTPAVNNLNKKDTAIILAACGKLINQTGAVEKDKHGHAVQINNINIFKNKHANAATLLAELKVHRATVVLDGINAAVKGAEFYNTLSDDKTFLNSIFTKQMELDPTLSKFGFKTNPEEQILDAMFRNPDAAQKLIHAYNNGSAYQIDNHNGAIKDEAYTIGVTKEGQIYSVDKTGKGFYIEHDSKEWHKLNNLQDLGVSFTHHQHSNHKDKQQASPVAALPDNLSKQLAELKDFAYPNPGINKQYNTAQIDNICASALNKLCARGNQNQELLDIAITQDYKEITVYYNNRLGNENSISLDANMAASIPHDETVAQLEKTINQHLTEQQNLEQQRNQSHGPRTV